jgi:hypothetical protein
MPRNNAAIARWKGAIEVARVGVAAWTRWLSGATRRTMVELDRVFRGSSLTRRRLRIRSKERKMALPFRIFLFDRRAAVALAAVAVASCTSSSSESLQQVRASNPSVTYEYGGDEELLQAQQEAVTFCSQYQSAPRPARITSSSNAGSNTVVFECDPNLPTTAPPEVSDSDLAYHYRSDQELLEASRNAHTYCTDNGWQQAVPSMRTNTDGSKTVVFQCT